MEFKKYLKIYTFGHDENKELLADLEDEIVIQEKIDGGNFRFFIKDGVIIFGSRTQQITSNEGEDSNVAKNFKRCVEFVRDNAKNLLEGYIYYGECCVKHTMSYDWEKIPPFLGFDVYSLKSNAFLPDGYECFARHNLPAVPLVAKIKAKDIKSLTDDDVPISAYASPNNKDQKAEGIVLKNYNKQIFAKYVRDKFKEENAKAFGGNPKYNKVDDTDNAVVVFKYCTNARIDKMIFKLIDEGHKLDMKLMEHLPKRVIADIYEEHWKDICWSNWVVDFRSVRKLITKRCVSVLKQVIVNNGLR